MTHFFDREKHLNQIELHNQAIERAAKIKEQKGIDIKLKNHMRAQRFIANQSITIQNDAKYLNSN